MAELDVGGASESDHRDRLRAARACGVSAIPFVPISASRPAASACCLTCFRSNVARWSSLHVSRQPIQKCFVPELRVLRLEHPMSLVREDHQLGRNTLPL